MNGKPETTTFVSATKLLATIPASDLAIVGNMNVTVTNPAPVGGTSAASPFTVDGYTISGPPGASLSPGQPAMIQITATPTANGFPNSISFSISGLPAGSTASFRIHDGISSSAPQLTALVDLIANESARDWFGDQTLEVRHLNCYDARRR